MSALQVYLIMQADVLNTIVIVTTGIFSIISLVVNVGYFDDNNKLPKKFNVIAIPILVLLFLIITITPSTKTLSAMYVLPKIANSESLDIIQDNTKEIVELGIDKIKSILTEEK